METAIPRIPGVTDHLTYLEFLGDKKRRDEYHKKLVDQIKRLNKVISVYGKASEIEKLHAEAVALKGSVLATIERKEKKLAEDREQMQNEHVEKMRQFNETKAQSENELRREHDKARQATAQAKEHERTAKLATDAAQKAKREAEENRSKIRELRKELEQRLARVKEAAEAAAA